MHWRTIIAAAAILALGCGGGGDNDASGSVDDGRSAPLTDGGGLDVGVADEGAPDEGRGDIPSVPALFGQSCAEHADCPDGWCIDHEGQPVCTIDCVDRCPEGWLCKGVSLFGGGDLTSVCVPAAARVCRDCAATRDCGGIPACALPDGATDPQALGQCLLRCEGLGAPCPAGFRCATRAVLPAADPAWVCAPTGSVGCCSAAREGAVEACTFDNEHGSCGGERRCGGADGWGPCSAVLAAGEVCDGADNDCDGQTDEGLVAFCNCGNGTCEGSAAGEDARTCPLDCAARGDGVCSPGESPADAPEDCCAGPDGTAGCGDGRCLGFGCGETPASCPQDCGSACGDGACDRGENPTSCPDDCAHRVCGNGVCEASDGGPGACPEDCGATCGNCVCEGGEDFQACPIDCGSCGDGTCSPCPLLGEQAGGCPVDCGAVRQESCNGLDDDGDGVTDEFPCDDGDDCTSDDFCREGTCAGVPRCGGFCGECGEDMVCGADRRCRSSFDIDGNTCSRPFEVGALPFEITGDTSHGSGDFSFGGNACPQVSWARGGGSKDHVYAFEPPETATYTLTLDSDFDAFFALLDGCTAEGVTCLAASDLLNFSGDSQPTESIRYEATAGQTVYLVVDGSSDFADESGEYTLRISAPCFPQCDGKGCGPDACGGRCGTCEGRTACRSDGVCVGADTLQGNTCGNPQAISLPSAIGSDFSQTSDVYEAPRDACPGMTFGGGDGSADHVYRFRPSATGLVTITLEGDYTGEAYVVADCAAIGTTCLGGETFSDFSGGSERSFEVDVEAGRDYFLIAEGPQTADDEGATFSGTLSAVCVRDCTGRVCGDDGCGRLCGACPSDRLCDDAGQCVDAATFPGNTCASAFSIGAVPFSGSGDTRRRGDAYEIPIDGCPVSSNFGDDAPDDVWSFTPQTSGRYEFVVTAEAITLVLYLAEGCEPVERTCVDSSRGSDRTTTLRPHLKAGRTYHLFVDGNNPGNEGAYDLAVTSTCTSTCGDRQCGDDGCEGDCGPCDLPQVCSDQGRCEAPAETPGNTCETAIEIDRVPFAHSGTTTNSQPNYAHGRHVCQGENDGHGDRSRDQVFRYTPEQTEHVEITLDESFGAALYVATDCDDIDGSCVRADQASDPSLRVSLIGGTTYWIFVDGSSVDRDRHGSYVLRIDPQ